MFLVQGVHTNLEQTVKSPTRQDTLRPVYAGGSCCSDIVWGTEENRVKHRLPGFQIEV
jgi:hypothetical protein